MPGFRQQRIDGLSAADVIEDPNSPPRRTSLYYEMIGNRAMYEDGWKAVTVADPRIPIHDQVWELYHVEDDFAEEHDLADQEPERLARLVEAWEEAARDNNVQPVEPGVTRIHGERPTATAARRRYVYYPGIGQIPEGTTHDVRGVSHAIEAQVVVPPGGVEGVLFAQGGRFGG